MNRSRLPLLLLGVLACGPGTDTASWHQADGYRWRDLNVPGRGEPGFTPLTAERTGLDFSNHASDSLLLGNRILAQGAGVALGDVDGDGLVDIYLGRTEGSNALYRNLGGWKFEDVTARSGTALADRFTTGTVFADVDGDGDLDLLVNALGGPNALLLNDGTGRFTEDTTWPGRASRAGATTTTVADTDGDGWLDIFTANYKAYTMQDSLPPQVIAFDQIVRQTGPRDFVVRPQYQKDYRVIRRDDLRGVSLVQRADPDDFYLHQAGGGYQRIPLTADRFRDAEGKPLPYEPESFGLAARFVDIDGDGDPDLYVANDFEDPDEFWINDGRGFFRLIEPTAQRTASNSTMAIDFADVDRDGRTDMFQVDMLGLDSRQLKTQMPTHTALPKQPGVIEDRPQMQRNTLFLNRGDRTFAQVAEYAGLTGSGWSWSTLFSDVDLDGWEDILIGTGHPWDLMDADTQQRLRNRLVGVDWRRMRWEYPPLKLPNVAFRNRGDLTFEDATQAWGFGFEDDLSHGLAIADLDGDGDQDVVLNRLESPVAVLRNNSPAARIAVRLVGDAPNTGAIGARIRILGGPVPVQEREVMAGGLYLSHSDLLQTFAAGTADSVTIEVAWRDGRRTVIRGARPNRLYEITTATATAPALADSVPPTPLFEDWTTALNHRHVDSAFDDYNRQLLLPNGLSQLGPGVAWIDIDRDGDEDLAIGAGRGGRLAFYRNDGGRLVAAASGLPLAADDQAGIIGLPNAVGANRLLVGISNYERTPGSDLLTVAPVRQFDWSAGRLKPGPDLGLPPDSSSTGPIAAADYDLDGDLDLFVGGRVAPGTYPTSPSSRLFRNDAGRFVLDQENSRLLAGNGMISAALFADVDGDGDDDLLLALEWGPIRLLFNEQSRFSPAPETWGLSGLYSRWNGIAAGDLDGDGRLDLVVTSWGRNTSFQADSTRPLLLYFGPFGSRGETEMLLAREDPRIGAVAPFGTFGRVGYAIPSITQRLRTYHAWADASIEQVLGPDAGRAITFGATTLDHLALMNRGDHFEPVPLPREAQFAPAFYAGVADFDGDGAEDIFLSQNFFATEISVPRLDAGRSLLLRGDGRGGLTPIPGQESGLTVYGEQRGAAYADMDGDGRLDLVVSQNAAPTRLFHNTGARPGLRVRLDGPAGNPDGIGAQIRVVYGDRMGPVREVHAGSGYWSENGAVQVFGLSGTPTAVWVRWPGGRTETVPVPAGSREVAVSGER